MLKPIETGRLVLRELVESDFEKIHEIKSDPEVVKYLRWGPNSPEQTLRSLRKQIAFQTEENRQVFVMAAVLKETNEVIANTLLMIRDAESGNAEIGYFLNSRHWNKGYGKEIVGALLELGFNVLNLHRIFATCDVDNSGSKKLLEGAGMRMEGHFIKDLKVKGEWRDNYLFALLKEEYRGVEQPS